MARRYYLSPLEGTGAEHDGYRPVVAAVAAGAAWNAVLPTGPGGAPLWPRCLVVVEADATTHAAIDALPGVRGFGNAALTTLVANLPGAVQTGLANACDDVGASPPQGDETLRQVMRRIGTALDVTFHGPTFEGSLVVPGG